MTIIIIVQSYLICQDGDYSLSVEPGKKRISAVWHCATRLLMSSSLLWEARLVSQYQAMVGLSTLDLVKLTSCFGSP